MNARFVRRASVTTLCLAIVACAFAFASSAFASIPGDSATTAIAISGVPFSRVDTMTPINSEDGLDYEMWYRVHLIAGHTVNVTSTVLAGGDPNFWVRAVDVKKGEFSFTSDPVNATTRHLALLPNRTTDYYINVWSSNPGTCAVSAADIDPIAFSMSKFTVPAKAKKNKKFAISVVFTPDYDGFVSPSRFYLERKSGKHFKKYKYLNATILDGTATWTKMGTTTKLPKGTFRIRARFIDAVHPATFTKWKTLKVK